MNLDEAQTWARVHVYGEDPPTHVEHAIYALLRASERLDGIERRAGEVLAIDHPRDPRITEIVHTTVRHVMGET